jgi:signal transduction histidine kinase
MTPDSTPGAELCPCDMLHQVPVACLITDRELNVLEGNDLFWDEIATCPPATRDTPLDRALPEHIVGGIRRAADEAIRTGKPVDAGAMRILPPGHPHRVVDLVVAPASLRDVKVLVIASSAVGDAGRRVEELTLLHDMIRVLRQQRDVGRVLFTTLSCATAGSGGLGFNRAWVLLCDAQGEWLEGEMALGPASREDAHRIWAELTSSPRTLDQFAAAYDRWVTEGPRPLQDAVRRMRFSMSEDVEQLPVLAIVRNRAFHVWDAQADQRVPPELAELIDAREFVVVPMTVGEGPHGVIMADNLYSGAPISRGHVRLLSLFAQHAGMAIEDAQLHRRMADDARKLEQAYAELQKAQDEVVRTSKLAALGEMAARIAHDLRNPLVTLGGWARAVQEDPEDTETAAMAAKIIAEESASLESMLSMLLEPFSSRGLRLAPTDLNQLVEDTLLTQENRAQQRGIRVTREYAPDLPPVPVDPGQFRRCVSNLIDNAIEAMSQGGTLSVVTRQGDGEVTVEIGDTGIGISEEQLPHIFDAFYTTGHFGSGLGLAIVWDIVQAHGFRIDVRSQLGRGSSFAIHMPLVTAPVKTVPVEEA